jgi:uncharacterized protein
VTLAALCAFAFLAGLIDSVAGGGGLIQLPATLLLLPGVPIATLLGTNKVVSMAATGTAVLRYVRRVSIPWSTALPAAAAALVGAFLGARVVSHLHAELVRPLILVLLIAVAAFTVARPGFGSLHAPKLGPVAERWLAILVGATLGFYDGFFGPGMGSFLIFAFVGVFGFDFLTSSATAKVVNFASGIAALAYFAGTGQVLFRFAIPMACAGALGSVVGTRLAVTGGGRVIRPLFLVMVSGMILRFAWETVKR